MDSVILFICAFIISISIAFRNEIVGYLLCKTGRHNWTVIRWIRVGSAVEIKCKRCSKEYFFDEKFNIFERLTIHRKMDNDVYLYYERLWNQYNAQPTVAKQVVNWWAVLGVSQNSSRELVKKAYRSLVMQYHPDRGGNVAKFQEVQKAYEYYQSKVK